MSGPIDGGKVVVSLSNGQSSKFDIRIITPNRIFVSPEGDPNNISSVSYLSGRGWKVDGTDTDYMIEFEPPLQIAASTLTPQTSDEVVKKLFRLTNTVNNHVLSTYIINEDFADANLEQLKSVAYPLMMLLVYDSIEDRYYSYEDYGEITREQLFQKLDWFYKHNFIYAGYILLGLLSNAYEGVPQSPRSPQPERAQLPAPPAWRRDYVALEIEDYRRYDPIIYRRYDPIIYDGIDWILSHDLPIDYDPREEDYLRNQLRNGIIHAVFTSDNPELFRRLYQIPRLFDFISAGAADEPEDADRFINIWIRRRDANKVKEEYMRPLTKGIRRR